MNTRTLIATAVFAFAASGAATAQIDAYPETYTGPQVQKSDVQRAAVKAQVLAAQADGTLHIQDLNYPRQVAAQSRVTRAEVRAELRRSLMDTSGITGDGVYPEQTAFIGERGRSTAPAQTLSASAPVKASGAASQN